MSSKNLKRRQKKKKKRGNSSSNSSDGAAMTNHNSSIVSSSSNNATVTSDEVVNETKALDEEQTELQRKATSGDDAMSSAEMSGCVKEENVWSELSRHISASVAEAVSVTSCLHSPVDHEYWKSFKGVAEVIDRVENRILSTVSRMASFLDPEFDVSMFELKDSNGSSRFDEDDRFRGIVECLDTALELTDSHLDRAKAAANAGADNDESAKSSAASKSAAAASCSPLAERQPQTSSGSHRRRRDRDKRGGNDIAKPQLQFSTPVDNSSETVFVPLIRSKPNATVPLPLYDEAITVPNPGEQTAPSKPLASSKPLMSPQLSSAMQMHVEGLGVMSLGDRKVQTDGATKDAATTSAATKGARLRQWPHPYETELNELVLKPEQLQRCKEKLFSPLQQTPLVWIDTLEHLSQLSSSLNDVSEFAVDLEHHHHRSYLGFTCLMQISTRTTDYIVDTLALREHLHVLNDSFTNPHIMKVLHGADRDITWLQRDFGLYVVNMFDTGQAARVLGLRRFSLQYLLEHYCDVKIDKQYQLADWRVRPVPDEMVRYARMDTHYLLYIFDRMRNELIDFSLKSAATPTNVAVSTENFLVSVFDRSRRLCLQKFEKPIVTSSSHLRFLQRNKIILTPVQTNVMGALFRWRDEVARDLDESCGFVMAANAMLNIAKALPTNRASLFASCHAIPSTVRSRADEILALIAKAMTLPPPPPPKVSLATGNDAMDVAAHAVQNSDDRLDSPINALSGSSMVMADTTSSVSPVNATGSSARPQAPIVSKGSPAPASRGIFVSTMTAKPSSSLFAPNAVIEDDSSDDEERERLSRATALVMESLASTSASSFIRFPGRDSGGDDQNERQPEKLESGDSKMTLKEIHEKLADKNVENSSNQVEDLADNPAENVDRMNAVENAEETTATAKDDTLVTAPLECVDKYRSLVPNTSTSKAANSNVGGKKQKSSKKRRNETARLAAAKAASMKPFDYSKAAATASAAAATASDAGDVEAAAAAAFDPYSQFAVQDRSGGSAPKRRRTTSSGIRSHTFSGKSR